jgi:hypothetical protein
MLVTNVKKNYPLRRSASQRKSGRSVSRKIDDDLRPLAPKIDEGHAASTDGFIAMRCLCSFRDLRAEAASLAVWLVVGLVVAVGLYVVTRSVGGVVVVLLATVATWLSFFRERQFRRELVNRTPLSDGQFFERFYSRTDISPEIVNRLKPIYCSFFEMDPTRLQPHDIPPEFSDIDTCDLVEAVEKEFEVSWTDEELEQMNGSFDSIVHSLARRTQKQ